MRRDVKRTQKQQGETEKAPLLTTKSKQALPKKKMKKTKKAHDEQDDDGDESDRGQEMTAIRKEALAKAKKTPPPPLKPTKPKIGPKYGPLRKKEAPTQVIPLEIDDAIDRLGYGPFQRRILVAAGLCFAADSMEVLLLSFLSVVLQAKWQLTEEQTASITSSVFGGALLGTLILGPLGDRMGRKPVFSITAAIITIFGFATAFTNSFWPLLFCRFIVGFGVGGLTVPFDTLAEFIPTSHRGSNLMTIEYFWTFGTLLVPILALISLGEGDANSNTQNDWRVFVILCALPCLISTILGLFVVPESPRWLLREGESGKALAILRKAAARNGKNPMACFPAGTQLIDEEGEEESSNFSDLLKPQWRRITLLLWGTWAGFAFCYYGTIIAVTLVFSEEEDGKVQNGNDLYSFDYAAIFTSASSEIAGTTLVIFLLDRIGRVPTQTLSYFGGGVSVFVLCMLQAHGNSSHGAKVVAAFLARMFFMGGSCSTWVFTAEILTTGIRTTGHSAANAVARLGGSFSPYLVTEDTGFTTIGIVMLIVSLTTALVTYQLPETKGKRMGEAALAVKNPPSDDDDDEDDIPSYGVV